jgi:beta-carotene hydroxylase
MPAQPNSANNAATDFRSATTIARSFETRVAWPTIALTVIVVGGFWGLAYFAAVGALSLWAVIPINAFLAYAAYTPAHEAVHGNVHHVPGRAQSDGSWLNNLVGAIASSALLHNFPMHQLSHLAHHAHTNDQDRDPDHWMAVRGVVPVTLRAFSLIFVHYRAETKLCLQRASDGKKRLFLGIAQNLLWLALVALIAWQTDWTRTLLATLGSAWLGSAFLAWAFDWLPHVPHQHRERFLDTCMTQFPAPMHALATRVLLFQNYHHIHHLWPRVPFHAYQKVHDRLAPYLLEQKLLIRRFGARAAS